MARTAHLCCEMMLRLSAAGQYMDERVELPLMPVELSEVLGMSRVQADHALQELRRAGLASFREGWLTIHDWPALAGLAGFEPDYLHLSNLKALLSSLPVQPR